MLHSPGVFPIRESADVGVKAAIRTRCRNSRSSSARSRCPARCRRCRSAGGSPIASRSPVQGPRRTRRETLWWPPPPRTVSQSCPYRARSTCDADLQCRPAVAEEVVGGAEPWPYVALPAGQARLLGNKSLRRKRPADFTTAAILRVERLYSHARADRQTLDRPGILQVDPDVGNDTSGHANVAVRHRDGLSRPVHVVLDEVGLAIRVLFVFSKRPLEPGLYIVRAGDVRHGALNRHPRADALVILRRTPPRSP